MFSKKIAALVKKCEYLHEEKDKYQEEGKLMDRLVYLEKIVEEKSLAERKMEHSLRELEKVVKAITCKVLYLEEKIVKVKVNSKTTQMNEPFKDTSDCKNSTPVSKKEHITAGIEKSSESKKELFKCEKCEYKCKKEVTLKERKKHKA